ncbi:MAG: hypothetical protein NT178_12460 [Proteobacteria bacterium]|nr:hypothetical protein [Pseudomonadota bacterium]
MEDNEFMGRGLMLLEADFFSFIKSKNKSKNPVMTSFKTTFAKYHIKNYVPFFYVISANTIKIND